MEKSLIFLDFRPCFDIFEGHFFLDSKMGDEYNGMVCFMGFSAVRRCCFRIKTVQAVAFRAEKGDRENRDLADGIFEKS